MFCNKHSSQPSPFLFHQVVIAVSWPIPYKNPLRKLFFNLGFQFNYNEPFAASNFYNPTYYQNIFNSRDLKESPGNFTEENNSNDRVSSRSIDGAKSLVGKDLTAAQFYESIEDNFAEYVRCREKFSESENKINSF